MGEYDDAVRRIRDSGLDEEAEVFEKFSATALRKKAEERDQYEAKARDLESALERMKSVPKKYDALREAGVDLSQLRPAERREIERIDFGDDPLQWADQVIQDLELEAQKTEPAPTQEPNAAGVVRAARAAPIGGGTQSPVITAEDIADWPQDRQMAFAKKHPEEWEQLKRGAPSVNVA